MIFPSAESEYLIAFVDAVRARSRALKHKFQVVTCERSLADAQANSESVTLLLRGNRRDSLQLSLRAWADRWCRFDARKAADKGWAFEWFYYGRAAPDSTPAELISAIEQAHECTWDERPDEIRLEAIWSPLLLRGPRA